MNWGVSVSGSGRCPPQLRLDGPHLPGSCIREDINNLRSDDLRRETVQVQMDLHLERIEIRLNLHVE